MSGVPDVRFHATPVGIGEMRPSGLVLGSPVGAIVAGKDDERVVGEFGVIERAFMKGGNRDTRYDYLYKEEELDEWIPRILQMGEKAEDVYVIGNNHFRGQAPANVLQPSLRQRAICPRWSML